MPVDDEQQLPESRHLSHVSTLGGIAGHSGNFTDEREHGKPRHCIELLQQRNRAPPPEKRHRKTCSRWRRAHLGRSQAVDASRSSFSSPDENGCFAEGCSCSFPRIMTFVQEKGVTPTPNRMSFTLMMANSLREEKGFVSLNLLTKRHASNNSGQLFHSMLKS
ncbi:Grb2-Associated-Binding Protein 3 [Manis pentadactyla]|nr:Grb2-Associated-Binding Protein 3 [Manis pentadactyla]